MIGFLLGFLAGYAVMYWRHAAQVRETNRVLEMMLAGWKAQRLPMPNAAGQPPAARKETV
jgi:hypothetical protein